jgi:hypothetical protein
MDGTAERAGGWSITAWTAAGVVLYGLGFLAAFGVIAAAEVPLRAVGLAPEAGTLGLSLQNAAWIAVWGLLAAAGAMWVGRRIAPRPQISGLGLAFLVVGLGLAAASELCIDEFVRAWAGEYDPEYVGLSVVIPPAVIAVALAAWAALALPRDARVPVSVLGLVAALGLAVALASNLPGVVDGIAPGHLPIAAAFCADAIYAASAGFLAMLHPGPRHS